MINIATQVETPQTRFESHVFKVLIDSDNYVRVEMWGRWVEQDVIDLAAAINTCTDKLRSEGLPVFYLYDLRRADIFHGLNSGARKLVIKYFGSFKFDAMAGFGLAAAYAIFTRLIGRISSNWRRAMIFNTEAEAIAYLKNYKLAPKTR